jgi:nucleoside-diphosphate-sugar epimerase
MPDTCLVTGASGFVGGHIVERLVRDGHRVRGLVRTTSDVSLLEKLGVELAYGDLTDAASVSRSVDGCRYVLHCAALVSDWATIEEIRQVNVGGTRNVLDASAAASVERLVHLSTTDVYGYPGAGPIDETHPAGRFRNWYAQTKLEAEQEVRRMARAEFVILRPATVYGPRSDEVVGEIAAAIRRRQMLLIDGGRAIAGLTYVANVADAAALALRAETAAGETFNVTDGLPVTWRQFVDDLADGLGCPRARWSLPYRAAYGLAFSLEHGYRLIRKTTGARLPALLSRQAVHVLGRDQDFSNSKARTSLGWEPHVDYRTGMEAVLEWLRD